MLHTVQKGLCGKLKIKLQYLVEDYCQRKKYLAQRQSKDTVHARCTECDANIEFN